MTTQPNTCKDCGKLTPADQTHTCSPQVANTNDADREAMTWALLERLGPHALVGDKMNLIDAFEHGFEAALLHARKNVQDGFVIVPIEPTKAMISAGKLAVYQSSVGDLDPADLEIHHAYLAMIDAVKEPNAAERSSNN